jgi:hypothetical protein
VALQGELSSQKKRLHRRARWRTAHRDARRADDQAIDASRRTLARAWASLHSSASRVRVKTRGGLAHATMQSVRAEEEEAPRAR